MVRHISKALLATLAGAASFATLAAGDSGRGHRNDAEFIAVFRPQSMDWAKDPQRCPDPNPLVLTMTGKAQTTVGLADVVQTHCEDAGHTLIRGGVSKMTLANGDVLQGTYEGRITRSADNTFVIIDGTWANTGGTGKFGHAHGKGVSAGSLDFATGEVIIAARGSL